MDQFREKFETAIMILAAAGAAFALGFIIVFFLAAAAFAAPAAKAKVEKTGGCEITPFRRCLLNEAGGRLDPGTCTVHWRNIQTRDACAKKHGIM